MAVSPDGKLLAAHGVANFGRSENHQSIVCIWDAETGDRLKTIHGKAINALAFSPDGEFLAGRGGNTFHLWNSRTWQSRTFPNLEQARQIGFTSDGKQLIANCDNDTMVWLDLETGKPVRHRDPWPNGRPKLDDGVPAEYCTAKAISRDGSVVAFAISTGKRRGAKLDMAPGPIRLVETASGKVLREIASDHTYQFLAFSNDGRTLAATGDHTVQLINVADGKGIRPWTPWRGPGLLRAAFSPDGQTYAVFDNSHLEVFDFKTGKQLWHRLVTWTTINDPLRLAYFPDGKTIAFADEANIQLFDTASGKPLPPTRNSVAPIEKIFFGDGGDSIITVGQMDVGRWDVATRKQVKWWPLAVMDPPYRYDISLERYAISHGGRLCLEQAAKGAVVRDIMTDRVVCSLPVEEVNIRFAAFSPDGKIVGIGLAGGGFYYLDLFEVSTGKKHHRLRTHLSDCEFSADGTRTVTAPERGALQLMDVGNGRPLCRIDKVCSPDREQMRHMAFAADGRTLAVYTAVEDKPFVPQVQLFATTSGRAVGRVQIPAAEPNLDSISSLAVSPDGRWLATVGYRESGVRLWETASGLLYHHFDGHRDQIQSVAFAPDGRTLATGGRDGVVLIWDMAFPLRGKAKPTDRWTDLAGSDVPNAWAAVQALADTPDAVRFLRERLTPVRAVPKEDVTRRMAALSAASFAEREQAMQKLADFREAAQPELEIALKGELPPEGRRRVQKLLDQLRSPTLTGERLRQWRAVAILERIGSPDAVALLKELAGGLSEARLTRDAADARARLAH